MPAPFVEGAETAVTVYDVDHFFQNFSLSLTFGDRVVPVLEIPDGFRIDDVSDAEITCVAYIGSETGQASITSLVDAAINREAPAALAWTDTAATPVSMLPASFWAKYPLNTWRITAFSTGAQGAKEQITINMTLKPKYAAYTP